MLLGGAVYRDGNRLMVRSVCRMACRELASDPHSGSDRGVCIHRAIRKCSARQLNLCVGVGLLSYCDYLGDRS